MGARVQDADLQAFLLRMGDSCLILGHRISEWCGHAPALEDDIAMANVALDLIGHTRLWLELAGEVEGAGRSADDLAFLRDAGGFRNVLLVELPNGDFGNTLMRQFLFDAWHVPKLRGLAASSDTRVAAVAQTAVREATYHLSRSTDLVIRLGDGTEESHGRMQAALDRLWPYAIDLLDVDDGEASLAGGGVVPQAGEVAGAWRDHVGATLAEATLVPPADGPEHRGGRRGFHTEHLGYILAEMQFLQRAYPGAVW